MSSYWVSVDGAGVSVISKNVTLRIFYWKCYLFCIELEFVFSVFVSKYKQEKFLFQIKKFSISSKAIISPLRPKVWNNMWDSAVLSAVLLSPSAISHFNVFLVQKRKSEVGSKKPTNLLSWYQPEIILNPTNEIILMK